MTGRRISRRELSRQLVHFGVGWIALLLPFLSWGAAVGVAASGVAVNLWVLPRLPGTREIFRPQEGRLGGIVLYSITVLVLVIVLPYPLAAGAWGILAAGDAASGLVGRIWGSRKLPWNREKSWVGSMAFILVAFVWAGFLLGWCGSEPRLAWIGAGAAAFTGAVAESLPGAVDDNITVGITAGLTLWIVAGLF